MKKLDHLQQIIEKEILDEETKKYFLNSVSNLNEDRQKAIIDNPYHNKLTTLSAINGIIQNDKV